MKDFKVGVEKMTPSWSKNGLLSAASFVFRNHRAEFATLYLLLCEQNAFLTCSWRFLICNKLEHLEFKLEKIIGI